MRGADAPEPPGRVGRRIALSTSCGFLSSTSSPCAPTRPRPMRWRRRCGSRRPPTGSGFTRYWLAEHHNMPAVAATSPPVLIAYLAAQTVADPARLRRRDAAQPRAAGRRRAVRAAGGRRARAASTSASAARPGSDPVTSMALRGAAGRDDSDIENVPAVPRRRRGADERQRRPGRSCRARLRGQNYILKATPAAASEPRLWLLGSSMYSAHLAAAKGLPYVFAHHFSGQGTEEALAIYRVGVPAQRPGRRAGDVPDGQRLGRAHPRRGRGAAAAQPADDGAAAHRAAAAARSTWSRTPRPRSSSRAGAGRSSTPAWAKPIVGVTGGGRRPGARAGRATSTSTR